MENDTLRWVEEHNKENAKEMRSTLTEHMSETIKSQEGEHQAKNDEAVAKVSGSIMDQQAKVSAFQRTITNHANHELANMEEEEQNPEEQDRIKEKLGSGTKAAQFRMSEMRLELDEMEETVTLAREDVATRAHELQEVVNMEAEVRYAGQV